MDLSNYMPSFLRLIATIVLLLSTSASALTVGDFTLGTDKVDVVRLLNRHFQSIRNTAGSRWQIEKKFISATLPRGTYALGQIPITEVNVFFNNEDRLNEVEIKLATASLDNIKQLIPSVERSQLEPVFRNSWEIFVDDGEIIYWVSTLFDSGSISLADKPTSTTNIEARRISNQKFKTLSDKLENIVDALKAPVN
jgi:hypothetical protein